MGYHLDIFYRGSTFFNKKTNQFESGPNIPDPGYAIALVQLSKYEVLLIGGITHGWSFHSRTWLFNDLHQNYTRMADANVQKAGSSCAKIFISMFGKEVVLCFGNEGSHGMEHGVVAEVFDIESNQWKFAPNFYFPHAMAVGSYFSRGNR